MASYDYLCKLTPEIEQKVIKDKNADRKFSLNALINKLLSKHYKLEEKK